MIEIRKVSHLYSNSLEPILTDVSLQIKKGEMVAIQGPSGSGKSTLLYLMGGLQKVQSGTLFFDGIPIHSMDDHQLAQLRNEKIGFVFQQFHLLAKTRARENILLPLKYSGLKISKKEVEARLSGLAEKLRISDRLDHLPNQLSGGQQQRIAIARALITDPPIILADEPTGNLDSRSSAQVMEILKKLKDEGKTIVVITHDAEVAAKCDRIIEIRDGRVAKEEEFSTSPASHSKIEVNRFSLADSFSLVAQEVSPAWGNLRRNSLRSALTMLGIVIGIAAVIAMMTLGRFTKERMLESYAEMGVNTLSFYAYPNWDTSASDTFLLPFSGLSWSLDLVPLRRNFPQISRLAPIYGGWGKIEVSFGGRKIENEVRLMGTNEDLLPIVGRKLLLGKNFNEHQVKAANPVCIIGYEIATKLFKGVEPLGQTLLVKSDQAAMSCRVQGILASTTSSKDWMKPNLQILVPHSVYTRLMTSQWSGKLYHVLLQLHPEANVVKHSDAIKKFFSIKYGNSGQFMVDSDSVLVAQMNRFLTIFTLLLTSVALISLAVGGIGIANMMLVSVSERYREIGLRKALGATPELIRIQLLIESVLLCSLGGFLGIVFGVASYQSILYGASKLMPQVKFEWIIDGGAISLALVSILTVGLLSGLFPALRAEKLQVVEALRSE